MFGNSFFNCFVFKFQITGLFQFAFRLAAKVEGQFTSVERLNHFVKTLKPEGKFTADDINLVENWPSNGSIVFDNVSVGQSIGSKYVLDTAFIESITA